MHDKTNQFESKLSNIDFIWRNIWSLSISKNNEENLFLKLGMSNMKLAIFIILIPKIQRKVAMKNGK